MQPSPNGDKLAQLERIGFVRAGEWKLDQETIAFECEKHETACNVLYAFVVDGVPLYVGKTVQQLCKRMQAYRTPGQTQPTNIRNHKSVIENLRAGHRVLLYVLPDNGLMHYGDFHINLAAGLEDSIIKGLKPQWNGGRKESAGLLVPLDGAS